MKKRLKQADGWTVKEEHYAGALRKGGGPKRGKIAMEKRGSGGDFLKSFFFICKS